jgi:dsDNA-binding SOS-regulon protein
VTGKELAESFQLYEWLRRASVHLEDSDTLFLGEFAVETKQALIAIVRTYVSYVDTQSQNFGDRARSS